MVVNSATDLVSGKVCGIVFEKKILWLSDSSEMVGIFGFCWFVGLGILLLVVVGFFCLLVFWFILFACLVFMRNLQ